MDNNESKKFSSNTQIVEVKRPYISVKDIIAKVDQEDLFKRFLGIDVRYNKFFKAQHRKDKVPSATFRWFGDKLRLCDWPTGDFFDIFELLQRREGISFPQVLALITSHFNIEEIQPSPEIFKNRTEEFSCNIQIEAFGKWEQEHISFWKDYYFDGQHCLKHQIFAVKNAWINDTHIYGYTPKELCFCYIYPDNSKKLYFPNRKKSDKSPRFQGNSRMLVGWEKLPETGEVVIITKSHKEVACYDLFDIPAISEQGEGILVDAESIEELQRRFTYVIVNLDYDIPGIKAMKKYKKAYGLQCLFLPIGKVAKDFSGYLKLYGLNETLELVEFYKSKIY